jgi:hypothetical protein
MEGGNKMSERPTPETDARTYVPTLGASTVPAEFARQLERERDEAIRQRDETNESSVFSCNFYYEEKLKAERERDEAREKAERYRLEANSLMLQRDEAREALSRVDEIFCDGEDTHDDWMKMGIIAKDYLKGLE